MNIPIQSTKEMNNVNNGTMTLNAHQLNNTPYQEQAIAGSTATAPMGFSSVSTTASATGWYSTATTTVSFNENDSAQQVAAVDTAYAERKENNPASAIAQEADTTQASWITFPTLPPHCLSFSAESQVSATEARAEWITFPTLPPHCLSFSAESQVSTTEARAEWITFPTLPPHCVTPSMNTQASPMLVH